MILPIYVYGQPVLRKVAEDITPEYPNLKELIANMFETMVHRNLRILIKLISILISSKWVGRKSVWKKAV